MFSKAIILSVFALFICSSSRIVTNVAAQSDNQTLKVSSITTPNQTFSYTIKRLREKISLTWLGFFNQKGLGSYNAYLARERGNELIYISEHEKDQYLETSVSRYITQLGLLGEQYDAENVNTETISTALEGFDAKFQELRDTFPSQTAQWLLMQQSVDTTQVLLSKVHESK